MIHLMLLGPLAVAGGGLVGLVHERFRRKRLAEQLADKPPGPEQDALIARKDDLVELKYAERSALTALGVAAAGTLFFPPLGLLSLPFLGYSGFNWLRAHYPSESRQWYKSPVAIIVMGALLGSVLAGFWTLAALILTLDLALRRADFEWSKERHEKFMQQVKTWTRRGLQGENRWEWFPILLSRVSLGVFFAISGWYKLFTAAHWNGLLGAMIATGLPFPKFLSYFLASVEFYGGSLLAIGLLSTVWAIALAFAMIVAIVTVEIPNVIPPGLGPLMWLDWFLFLPQVMYVILFIWLIIRGPGPHSVDALIARKLGLDEDSDSSQKALDDKSSQRSDEDSVLEPDLAGGAPQPA